MKPAGLKPGHRIALTAPINVPECADALLVQTEAEIRDDNYFGTVVSVDVQVTAVEAIGPGELLVRSGAARVTGLPNSPEQYRLGYRPDTDVVVEAE